MEKLLVRGGNKLTGTVQIEGAKNAVLPILAATLLADEGSSVIANVPELSDVYTINELLKSLNASVEFENNTVKVKAVEKLEFETPIEYVRKMRASFFVMGSLLARNGRAKVALPGGCAIGSRPVELHLKGFEALGATIKVENGFVEAVVEDCLRGTNIYLDFPSVGATENIMMAAVLAIGNTVIENAAMEPEIDDLADFLMAQGVKIEGSGTSRITIYGMKASEFKPNQRPYRVIGDRIEAATFIIGGIMSGGEVKVTGFNPKHLSFVLETLTKMGANLEVGDDYVTVKKSNR